MSLPVPKGKLTVSGLSYFVPERETPILNSISFELQAGEILGVTGPSAAGKSTLARMLVGALSPTKGAVRIDGFDLNSWNHSELGEHIGYLPQDVELFEGAVNENIARFNEFNPEDVIEAAKTANIYEMIALLTHGFDTHIAAGGATLSGGQRQRVALARATYKSPAIIVLDEPGSNLDTEGEHALRSTLEKLKEKGSTVVIVTHRPHLLSYVDKVLVVQEGNNAMFGDAEKILAQIARPIAGISAQGSQNA
jgi:ABC-type protease/lipase transport system fused ATPase/permease subunit